MLRNYVKIPFTVNINTCTTEANFTRSELYKTRNMVDVTARVRIDATRTVHNSAKCLR